MPIDSKFDIESIQDILILTLQEVTVEVENLDANNPPSDVEAEELSDRVLDVIGMLQELYEGLAGTEEVEKKVVKEKVVVEE